MNIKTKLQEQTAELKENAQSATAKAKQGLKNLQNQANEQTSKISQEIHGEATKLTTEGQELASDAQTKIGTTLKDLRDSAQQGACRVTHDQALDEGGTAQNTEANRQRNPAK